MIENKDWLSLPASVAIAGAFIGFGIYMGAGIMAKGSTPAGQAPIAAAPSVPTVAAKDIKVAPITAEDHIRGNRNAKALIVEYSDLSCPFCKQFHSTLVQTTAKFSKDEVAWVYRHFPLDAIHPAARKQAEATECAAEQGGNDAFWRFVDKLFEATPSNGTIGVSELPGIASQIGLDAKKLEACLSSSKYAAKVEAQSKSGTAAGAVGTPYSIIVTSKGTIPVNGSVPATVLETEIRNALSK